MDKELEEVAENLFGKLETGIGADRRKIWLDGAKYQADRMYTYDEMRRLAYNAFCLGQMDNPRENKFNGWIEQFKK